MARFQQKIHWILHNSDADLRQFKRHSSARFVFACSLAAILPIFFWVDWGSMSAMDDDIPSQRNLPAFRWGDRQRAGFVFQTSTNIRYNLVVVNSIYKQKPFRQATG